MTDHHMPTVLVIAGSDSSGGAGVQGDLKTLQAFHVYGVSVLTSITAQNTRVVKGIHEVPADYVALQIDAVCEDISIGAVKTGMLSSRPIIEIVADRISTLALPNVVVDPVMQAKSGQPLLTLEAKASLLQEMFPLACLVTPNLPEAEELTGLRIRTIADMREAARRIIGCGAGAVLVKGGHLEGVHPAVDLFHDGREFLEFGESRVVLPLPVHGTGCALASAIAGGLAGGLELVQAISQAKEFLTVAIRRCLQVGKGHPVLDHAWRTSISG